MTPETLSNLIVNVGLVGSLVLFFVWQGSQRETANNENKAALELFIRETLLRIIEDSSAEKKENHILLNKCVDALDRCLGVLQSFEDKE